MPVHVPRVGYFVNLLAGFGVEVLELPLPRHDGSMVLTTTLVRETEDGHRLMVPLGDLGSYDFVEPDVVDSWCDRLQVERIGYGLYEED